jgi:hypothetical protein
MDEHSSRFVYNQQTFILIENVERDAFRLKCFKRNGVGGGNGDTIADAELVAGFGGLVVYGDSASANQFLNIGARSVIETGFEESI